MRIVQCCYLLKPEKILNPDQEDINTASSPSPVSEQSESPGLIEIGFQGATKVLQSVVMSFCL